MKMGIQVNTLRNLIFFFFEFEGIRIAASRRLQFELNIDILPQNLYPYERIIYKANSDDLFEEYELDYMIFGEINLNIKDIKVNRDEVEEVKYIDKKELEIFRKKNRITPWFELVLNLKGDQYFTNKHREKIRKIYENDNIKTSKYILPIIKF